MSIIAAELGRAVMSDEEFAKYKQMGSQPTRDMVSLSRGQIKSLTDRIEFLQKVQADNAYYRERLHWMEDRYNKMRELNELAEKKFEWFASEDPYIIMGGSDYAYWGSDTKLEALGQKEAKEWLEKKALTIR